MQYDINPILLSSMEKYNMCLAAPAVTWKGDHKIEPKAKRFSHCKKNQSSRPNQIDRSERNTKLSQSLKKLQFIITLERVNIRAFQQVHILNYHLVFHNC